MTELNYSLWLMPTGELQHSLTALIQQTARQYNAPTFPAHITLLGNVRGEQEAMLARTQEFAAHTTALPIILTELDTTPEYYRALFVRIQLSDALTHCYEQARTTFAFTPHREYRPHLSLLYSDLSREQKQQIINTLQPQLQHLPHTFAARTIHLYSTDGPIESWQPIGAFPLT